jgi:SAM-dependent methyltransferase
MRGESAWKPTKYVEYRGRLIGNRDTAHLELSSRLVADLTAAVLAGALRRHCRGHLLDLGCGTVPLFGIYAPVTTETTCVDWASSLHDLRHADVLCDISAPLPFADAVADTVLATDVLEHLARPAEFVREIARILKPGGKAVLSTPFNYWIHEAPVDYYRYTEFGIRLLGKDAGLTVLELRPVGGGLDVVADTVAKLTAPITFVGRLIARVTQSAAGFFGSTGLGRAARQRSAGGFPLAYVTVLQRSEEPS